MRILMMVVLMAACAVPKKKTRLPAFDAQNTSRISTGSVMTSSITMSSDVYLSSFTFTPTSRHLMITTIPASGSISYLQFSNREHKSVYYHSDGRITWSGGFKNEREVIRFLVETMAEIHGAKVKQ